MTSKFEQSLVRDNIFDQNNMVLDTLRALTVKNVTAGDLSEIAQDGGSLNNASFGDNEIDNDGIHTSADVVNINWWMAINLSDDEISSLLTVVFRTIAGVNYLYVGGEFERIGGLFTSGIARYNFSTREWETVGDYLAGIVYSIAFDSADTCYIAGSFAAGGSGSHQHVAKLVNNKWAAVASSTLSSWVYVIAIDSADNIYIGGYFLNAGGDAAADYFAMLSAGNWVHVGGSLNGAVLAIAFDSAGVPHIGGEFTNAGGDASVDYFAKLSGGTTWVNVGGTLNAAVYAIAIDSYDVPYISGFFTNANGDALADYFAKLSSGNWVNVGGGGFNGAVYGILIDETNDRYHVYTFGGFTTVGELTSVGYAAVLKNDQWEHLKKGLGGFSYAGCLGSDGTVYAVGEFLTAGSIVCNCVAAYMKPLSAAIDNVASLFELYSRRATNKTVEVIAAFNPSTFIFKDNSEIDLFSPYIRVSNLSGNFAIKITITGRFFNDVGSNQTITFKPSYDGSLVGAANSLTIATSTVARSIKYECVIQPSANKKNYVTVDEYLFVDANQQGRSTRGTNIFGSLAGEQEINVTAVLGTANAALNFLCSGVIVELIPKATTDRGAVQTYFCQAGNSGNDIIDAYIENLNTTTNYGTNVQLVVGESNVATTIFRSLIKPVLSGIPSNATILSATLCLVIRTDLSSNARDYQIFRVLRNWVESEATWVRYSAGNNWATAGCGNSTSDYDGATVLATTNFSASEAAGNVKEFVLTASEIQKLIDGTYTYYGFLIKAVTELNDTYTVYSSNETTEYLRPWMKITYVTP